MDRELRLLLCCCRLEAGDAVASEIRSLLDAELDWNELIRRAVWHEVTPLLHRTLDRVAPDRVPPAVAHALRINHRGWAEHTQNLWRELRRVLDGLNEGGVATIPFKGPVLAQSVYGEMALRPFRDLDFLLRPQDVDRALTLLEALGYVRPGTMSPKRDRHFRLYAGQYRIPRGDAKVWIEPHWALSQHVFAIDLDYEVLWQRSTPVDIDGYRTRRFALRDEILTLCVHGYRAQWERLKWICDIAEIVRANPTIDWDALVCEARAVGCARILRLGLALAHDLLDAPVPDRVIAIRDGRLEWLIAAARRALSEARIGRPRVGRLDAFHLHARERMWDKTRYVLRTALAPRPVILETVNLPDTLFWAYYPTRWVHDYLLLPAWLLGKRVRGK